LRAFILVGGQGTRLSRLGLKIPKPMIDFGGKPFLEHLIRRLACFNIEEIVLCVGFGAKVVQDYFQDGRKMGVSIFYATEDTPLGTGGAIKNAEIFAVEENLILNGDSYLALDFSEMQAFHRAKGALVTLACTKIANPLDYGNLQLDSENRITAFAEKIPGQTGLINGGIYLFGRAAFDLIPPHQKISVEQEAFPKIVATGKCFGFITHEYFIDIGTPERLEKAQIELLEKMG
jgi:mannose-1-phosphate guanylyltransferase